MAFQPVDPWSSQQREQALAVAARVGYHRQTQVGFAEFWSSLPVVDAAAPAVPVGLSRIEHGARILFSSGGSTGTPKFTSLTMAEVQHNCQVHGRSYQSAGVGPEDVVAVWGLPGLMSSEFTVYLALAQTGCCILPIGVSEPAEIIKQLQQLRASVLLVMPSDLLPVAQLLERDGVRLSSVRLVLTGGEALYPADENRYRALLGTNVRFRSTFQTSEVGAIGYQCDSCGFGEYHLHQDLHCAEIVEPDEAGIGELVTTNVARQLSPVLRQRTGDRVALIEQPCPCGSGLARIRLHGRTGKFVNFGGEKFDVNLLLALKQEFDLPADDFLLVLDRDAASRDRFVMRSRRVTHDLVLRDRASSYFRTLSAKVTAQLAAGAVAELAFADLTETELQVTVAGKVKHFVDNRS